MLPLDIKDREYLEKEYCPNWEQTYQDFKKHLITHAPYSDKEFDNARKIAEEKIAAGKCGRATAAEVTHNIQSHMAYSVNPVEWFACHDPKWKYEDKMLYRTLGSRGSYERYLYLVDKAIACGHAKTAQEAIQYWKDNK